MAQATVPLLRRLLLALGVAAGAVLALVLAFAVAGWIGSSIPRNDPSPPVDDGIAIMVETNGVHTGIIVPVVSPEMDWRALIPSAAMPVNGRLPTHIAIGWGEREVFMETPTWGDLKPSTVWRIATTGGDAVMRVSHYVRPAPGPDFRPVMLSRAAYGRMAEAIAAALPPVDGPRPVLRGSYNAADAFYKARGHYTLANTCNSWVGDMLAQGGVQMGRWTPFSGGVMKWIDEPPSGA